MSIGCVIVASNTKPLQEPIQHDGTSRLVNFFDAQALAEAVGGLLADSPARRRLGQQVREFAQAHFDVQRVCLPRQLA